MLAQKPAALELCHELGLALRHRPDPGTAHSLRPGRRDVSCPSLRHAPRPAASRRSAGSVDDAVAGGPGADGGGPGPPGAADGERSTSRLGRSSADDSARRRSGESPSRCSAGIHAGDVDRLSLRALFPGLAQADAAGGSLLLALRHGRPARHPDGAFRGLRHGMGQLVAALTAALPDDVAQTDVGVCSLRQGGSAGTENPSRPHFPPAWHRVRGGDRTRRLLRAPTCCSRAGMEAARLLADVDRRWRRSVAPFPMSRAPRSRWPTRGHRSTMRSLASASSCRAARPRRASWPAAGSRRSGLGGRRTTSRSFVSSPAAAFDADLLAHDDDALTSHAHRDLTPLLGLRAAPLVGRVYRWERAKSAVRGGPPRPGRRHRGPLRPVPGSVPDRQRRTAASASPTPWLTRGRPPPARPAGSPADEFAEPAVTGRPPAASREPRPR